MSIPVNNLLAPGNGSEAAKPAADLSPRVVELAQFIDRLPPGTFEITIQKSDIRAQDWHVEIVRTEKLQSFKLSKLSGYKPE